MDSAGGIVLLLIALYLLLALLSGRLEWLFRLDEFARDTRGPGDLPANVVPLRPSSVGLG